MLRADGLAKVNITVDTNILVRAITEDHAKQSRVAQKTLDAGRDYADGVIAFEGAKLGGEIFVSFDTKAVPILLGSGEFARLAT